MTYSAVVIGCSAGGLKALSNLLPMLPIDFNAAVIIVQHLKPSSETFLAEYLNDHSLLEVKEAEIREPLQPAKAYIAPPGYHLLIEEDKTFSINVDQRVSYAIPSIDVLFESAAVAYGEQLIGVILTGANSDGSKGLKTIKEYGGLTIVQSPDSAESSTMPQAAIRENQPDHIVTVEEIATLLINYIK